MDDDIDPTGGTERARAIADSYEPPPGSADAIAIRLVTAPGEGSDDLDPVDLLDAPEPFVGDLAEAVADAAPRRGPDEDDLEAWFDEVQGEDSA